MSKSRRHFLGLAGGAGASALAIHTLTRDQAPPPEAGTALAAPNVAMAPTHNHLRVRHNV